MTVYNFQIERKCSGLPYKKCWNGAYQRKYKIDRQISDWLLDNISRGGWTFWDSICCISFYNIEDAVTFELAWL